MTLKELRSKLEEYPLDTKVLLVDADNGLSEFTWSPTVRLYATSTINSSILVSCQEYNYKEATTCNPREVLCIYAA